MRTENDQARATIGDVVSHGAKTGDTTKGKSSQTSHREVIVVVRSKVLFQDTVDFVAAQRGGNQRRLAKAVLLEGTCHLSNQIGISDGLGEDRLDLVGSLRMALSDSTSEKRQRK